MIKKGFLREYCKKHNMTIKNMAEKTGIKIHLLYFYNRLVRFPSRKNINIICNFTNNEIQLIDFYMEES